MTRILLIAGAALALLAPAALGSTQIVKDPRGDGKSDLDVKQVEITDLNGAITAKISTFTPLINGVRPCLQVRAGSHATTRDYWLVGCAGPKPNRATPVSGGPRKPIGYVHRRYSMTFTFQASQLGVKASFRWRTIQTEEDHVTEAVPNRGWALHEMG